MSPANKRPFRPRFPVPIRRAVWAGQDHCVTVRIANPQFPMVRAAIFIRRVAVTRQDHFRAQFPGASNRAIKVLNFKPQQDAVAMGQCRISYWPMMMPVFPEVQLQEQLAVRNQLLVMTSPVPALAAQQMLVPAAARRNILHTNQRLWTHAQLPGGWSPSPWF